MDSGTPSIERCIYRAAICLEIGVPVAWAAQADEYDHWSPNLYTSN